MLLLIPTPIGNLNDLSKSCIEALNEVDELLVEDTRVTAKLLHHLGIEKKMVAFHAHNEHQILESIIEQLKAGKLFGLVSDAGTPSISDPGFLLVRECIKQSISVRCLAGPSAFVVALAVSGLPTDRFYFEGFLPRKKGRKTKFEFLEQLDCTIIIYESPHRILKTLNDIQQYLGGRAVSVSRELTKKFEETLRGSPQELILHFEKKQPKGEFVICIGKQGYTFEFDSTTFAK